MHPNPIFRQTPEARNIAFARAQAFGMLAVEGEGAPLVSHIPFLLSEDGAVAEFHLVRSNPIARALSAPMAARLAVVGPYSYVSPDWYGAEDQVPTWNYVAVHLVGEVELRPQDGMRDLLDRQSAHFEDQLLPKAPWTSDKMTPDVMARMMRQIVPCRMRVDEIHGTWKLNQNKDDDVRLRAAEAVEASGIGVDTGALAALMRDANG
ncbi:negative transcriptional regulator [Roseovarius atlanticus]|uniref:Negative transcriptional regulator n=1 Tax=Roseovarius atlanticus TaxID=1641875 RepID=A0A0T5NX75_9RHOB|nr:FMN-binding negative transcriptional regulator [Roseovarius atlanticus]KRS13538.1 negative transcriptional regulator [Roseovarius atlanticus]